MSQLSDKMFNLRDRLKNFAERHIEVSNVHGLLLVVVIQIVTSLIIVIGLKVGLWVLLIYSAMVRETINTKVDSMLQGSRQLMGILAVLDLAFLALGWNDGPNILSVLTVAFTAMYFLAHYARKEQNNNPDFTKVDENQSLKDEEVTINADHPLV